MQRARRATVGIAVADPGRSRMLDRARVLAYPRQTPLLSHGAYRGVEPDFIHPESRPKTGT